MLRKALLAAAIALTGCAVLPVPILAPGFFLEPEATGLQAPGADEPASRVRGYGLATLGARELIVRFVAGAVHKKPSRGTFKKRLRSGAQVYQLDSEADLRAVLEELWVDPDVEQAEPNVACKPTVNPSDPRLSEQWGVAKVGLPAAWDLPQRFGAASVVIAIVDSGVDTTHPDLAANIRAGGIDIVDGDNDPRDAVGHGTHVAGIAAAVANNAIGISGAAPGCKVLPVRVGDHSMFNADVADGIRYAADAGAKVINLSLGSPFPSYEIEQACDYAHLKGALVVAAAGNLGSTSPFYPASFGNCLSVGATASDDARATFSNYGRTVEPPRALASSAPSRVYRRRAGGPRMVMC
ncbi:MAG: S8 family serine peptidase [Candidatus Sericytochromatia bacterium]|nr:S8 family serine peptidase [Candidatus Sericytochromatia bacterium]